jgi:protoporphyrinogen IX oxidase
MLWLLALHIITLVLWCGSLLYLPALIANTESGNLGSSHSSSEDDSIARFVFTRVATPMAFLAIVSGTLVFLLDRTIEFWLLLKLTLVTGLVLGHAMAGALVRRAEVETGGALVLWCWLLQLALCGLMAAILWIVLAKPTPGWLPWAL